MLLWTLKIASKVVYISLYNSDFIYRIAVINNKNVIIIILCESSYSFNYIYSFLKYLEELQLEYTCQKIIFMQFYKEGS